MKKTLTTLAIAGLALPFAWACATDGSNGPNASTSSGSSLANAGGSSGSAGATTSGGSTSGGATTGTGSNTSASTGGSGGGAPGNIPSLVNVNLQNVLNDLSVRLQIDRANVPINIQLPIQLAANVCGVSVSALAASIASGQAGCTATTTSPQLTQAVQQQIESGGPVTGGDQNNGTSSNPR